MGKALSPRGAQWRLMYVKWEILLETGPVGTSCLACTEMRDPRKGGRTCHRVGTGNPSQQSGSGVNAPKFRFPDCSPGPALRAGLPEEVVSGLLR